MTIVQTATATSKSTATATVTGTATATVTSNQNQQLTSTISQPQPEQPPAKKRLKTCRFCGLPKTTETGHTFVGRGKQICPYPNKMNYTNWEIGYSFLIYLFLKDFFFFFFLIITLPQSFVLIWVKSIFIQIWIRIA